MQDGGNMVLRQSGESVSGHQEHIYAVNTQCSVRLQFYPQGFEWTEADPVLISQGPSQVSAPPPSSPPCLIAPDRSGESGLKQNGPFIITRRKKFIY